jgi:hypothetical protein
MNQKISSGLASTGSIFIVIKVKMKLSYLLVSAFLALVSGHYDEPQGKSTSAD